MPKITTKKQDEDEHIVEEIIDILDEKKGEDIVVLNIKSKSSIADYYVLCTGLVPRHVKNLVDEVEDKLKERFSLSPLRVNGLEEKEWIIMDYGHILVHIMLTDQRRALKLEELCGKKES